MPRSELWSFLQRRFAIATRARASGHPLDEALEQLTLSRRTMLRQIGAGTAGWALGCGQPEATIAAATGPSVVIVGAGIAGLVCGFQLAQAGVGVRIFDAQARIGGRIHTSRDTLGAGLVAELGAETLASDHFVIRGLCHAFDLALDDYCEDPLHAAKTLWAGGQRYTDLQLAEAFTPLAAAIERDRVRVGTFEIAARKPGPAAEFDRLNLAQWLDAAGVSGWFRDLLGTATTTEFGLDPDEQSALSFLMMFAGMQAHCFDPTFEVLQRLHVRGGNDLVTARLGEHLAGAIELESQLEAIRPHAERYRLSFRRGGRSQDVDADMVVLALPFTTLRDVTLEVPLPPEKRRAIAELGYGTNTKLLAGFKSRVWRTGGASGSVLTDLRFQNIWEATRLQSGEPGILVSYTGGRAGRSIGEGETQMQGQAFAAALDPIFPGMAAAHTDTLRFHWPSFAWAKGSYCCYRPGQIAAFRGVEAEPAERVFFAGEHTAKTHVGFMEGACESGVRAANEVLAALGLAAVTAPAAPAVAAGCGKC